MAVPMHLDPLQIEDFKVIASLSPDKLRAVVESIGQLEPAPVQPHNLMNTASAVLGEQKEAAESVIRQAYILYGPIRQHERTVEEVLNGIRACFESEAWTNENLSKWDAVAPHFGALLSLPIIRLVTSALDLSYEYTNLLRGIRILTDIRPIFDDSATGIQGAVIAHALRLRFESVEGPHELNISVDESDIKEIAEQCDRALKKARTARKLMQERAKIPTTESGTDDV